MKRSIFHPTHPFAATAILIAGFCTVASVNLQANDIQVGRYSLFAATPTEAQADPLQATITVQFPVTVRTVGEAVRHILNDSGYRLAGTEVTDAEAIYLFALPVPGVHRALGPVSLMQGLQTLVGPAFQLVEDPVHRLIMFERCELAWQPVQAAVLTPQTQRF